MSERPNRRILVTGAAGCLGVEVCGGLAQDGSSVVALVHDNVHLVRNDGRRLGLRHRSGGDIRVVGGDVTKSDLGLGAARLAELGASTDLIVHSAAITTFGLPRDVYQTVNVAGTENVVRLASDHGIPLIYLSTAYVSGNREGVVLEDEFDGGQTFGNEYERSKFCAELVVRRASRDGLPVYVVRPSIVVGRQSSGAIRDFKNIYTILRLTTSGRVQSLPAHFDALLDLVPVDYVSNIICEMAVRRDLPVGMTVHAVGGELQLADISRVLAEFPSFAVPRFIPPENFSLTALDERQRRYHDSVISLYASYLRRRVKFDDSKSRALLRTPMTFTAVKLLRNILAYGARVGYLGPNTGRNRLTVAKAG